jgi:hypothetical protein
VAKAISTAKTWERSLLIYGAIALIGIFFIYGSYQVALSHHAGSIGYFMLHLSFSLPEILIWLIAAIGAVRLKNYAMSIRTSQDGAGLNKVANALLLLVLYVILISVRGTITGAAADGRFEKGAVSLMNYLPLAVIALSALSLWLGSRELVRLVAHPKAEAWVPSGRFCAATVVLVIFALAYTLNFYRFVDDLQSSGDMTRFAASPTWLLFTYVLPHLAAWLLSFLACVNLAVYARRVTGIIYKELFRNLQRGVLLVFICTFLAQVLISSVHNDDELGWVLFSVYIVLLLCLFGFYLVYRGTRQLERIEQ